MIALSNIYAEGDTPYADKHLQPLDPIIVEGEGEVKPAAVEFMTTGVYMACTCLLLVPFLAVLIGRERVLPLLQRGKTALLRRGELVVGSLSFGLGSYLSWQGISGLMIN